MFFIIMSYKEELYGRKKGMEPAKWFYLVFYYLFLTYLSLSLAFVYLCGELNFITFVYGKIFLYSLFGSLLILWVLPLFVRKRRTAVMYGILTVCLCLYCYVPGKFFGERARTKYINFSYEDWSSYPIVRTVVYEDLKNRQSSAYIIGKTAEETKAILGEPDFESDTLLKYNTTPSPGAIEIELKDNAVTYVDYPLFF
ncbi:MAG: hypothetical protein LUD77_10540 [Clostridiales bacterium]|nr:hypothetical protein [Clostridiales bacterium]